MAEALQTKSDVVTYSSGNVKHLCRLDLNGAGQVTVEGNYAYLGYMYGPEGTTILDISDPEKPIHLSTLILDNPQTHSHKVRVAGDLMIVNSEQRPQHGVRFEPGFDEGGFKLYDISDRTNPKLINFHKTFGKGVHRFDMDENYAYISTELEGFVGNILVIYDLRNPSKLEEVGRWWMPGQNLAAGETPHPLKKEHRLHHALRHEDKMYAGLWMSGFAVIDVSDLSKPKTLSTYNPHPDAREPSHTLLRVPFPVAGRDIALGSDEERSTRGDDEGQPHGPFYIFDVTDPTKLELLSTYHVPEEGSPYADASKVGGRFGAHQFREKIDDTLTYVTWFAAGLRILDFKDPTNPEEVGYFIPEPGKGTNAPQTNDVSMDHRGLLYVTDKAHGFDVIDFKS
ncbi:RNA polymerase subunit sigma-70 [Alphaproteobacteria bacterium]|nr:RNA polymerase subunit sigma-70 [Alphaproteobacteria bacterium]